MYLSSMLACSLLRMHILNIHVYADKRLGKHTETDAHTRTHPALPLVAQATKVAGIAGDHLPVTSLVLSSNKEHTNKIHAKFLYSQFIPNILFVWGVRNRLHHGCT